MCPLSLSSCDDYPFFSALSCLIFFWTMATGLVIPLDSSLIDAPRIFEYTFVTFLKSRDTNYVLFKPFQSRLWLDSHTSTSLSSQGTQGVSWPQQRVVPEVYEYPCRQLSSFRGCSRQKHILPPCRFLLRHLLRL